MKITMKELIIKLLTPNPIWSDDNFEIYHKKIKYYVICCKKHNCSYDITINSDKIIEFDNDLFFYNLVGFDHNWDDMNNAVETHFKTLVKKNNYKKYKTTIKNTKYNEKC